MTLKKNHLIFESSTSWVAFVMLFNSQNFYISWRKDQKGLFLGSDSAGYKLLDQPSKVVYEASTVNVFHVKFVSTEENQIHCREEEPAHLSSLNSTPATLEDSRDSPQGP